jgi:uncharacterized membrane protein HdeD (DUF308 family)
VWPKTGAAPIIAAMTSPPHRPSRQRDQAPSELLLKGIFIALIGLALLLAPRFMAATELRAIVAESYLVGWFALLLGAVFITQYAVRRLKDKPAHGRDER